MKTKKSRPRLAPRSGRNQKISKYIITVSSVLCKVALLYAGLGLMIWVAAHIPLVPACVLAATAVLWEVRDEVEAYYGR